MTKSLTCEYNGLMESRKITIMYSCGVSAEGNVTPCVFHETHGVKFSSVLTLTLQLCLL